MHNNDQVCETSFISIQPDTFEADLKTDKRVVMNRPNQVDVREIGKAQLGTQTDNQLSPANLVLNQPGSCEMDVKACSLLL